MAGFLFFLNETLFAQNDKPLYTAPLGIEAYTFRVGFSKDPSRNTGYHSKNGIY